MVQSSQYIASNICILCNSNILTTFNLKKNGNFSTNTNKYVKYFTFLLFVKRSRWCCSGRNQLQQNNKIKKSPYLLQKPLNFTPQFHENLTYFLFASSYCMQCVAVCFSQPLSPSFKSFCLFSYAT